MPRSGVQESLGVPENGFKCLALPRWRQNVLLSRNYFSFDR